MKLYTQEEYEALNEAAVFEKDAKEFKGFKDIKPISMKESSSILDTAMTLVEAGEIESAQILLNRLNEDISDFAVDGAEKSLAAKPIIGVANKIAKKKIIDELNNNSHFKSLLNDPNNIVKLSDMEDYAAASAEKKKEILKKAMDDYKANKK